MIFVVLPGVFLKMKTHYLFIPSAVVLVSFLGSLATGRGMEWYKTINLPSWTPPGSIIGTVWTIIFILTAFSAIFFWNRHPRGHNFRTIIALFAINAVLNISWSFLFFGLHQMFWAGVEAIFLWLSVLLLILHLRPFVNLSAALLYPYLAWTAFAAYLTFKVWSLN